MWTGAAVAASRPAERPRQLQRVARPRRSRVLMSHCLSYYRNDIAAYARASSLPAFTLLEHGDALDPLLLPCSSFGRSATAGSRRAVEERLRVRRHSLGSGYPSTPLAAKGKLALVAVARLGRLLRCLLEEVNLWAPAGRGRPHGEGRGSILICCFATCSVPPSTRLGPARSETATAASGVRLTHSARRRELSHNWVDGHSGPASARARSDGSPL